MEPVREFYEEIASTQDRAIELARSGAREGTVIVARQQTQGRGRAGHRWESPGGGLHLSIVLASPEPAEPLLPLALGAALAEEFGRAARLPLRVKWPNDVLAVPPHAPSRKLAGVLVDRVAFPPRRASAVAGIGVNVSVEPRSYPPELLPRIIGLDELHPPGPPLDEVERTVVAVALRTAQAARDTAGRAELLAVCRRQLWGVGRSAWLDGRPVGRIVELGDDGALWVENGGDRWAIRAGDLRVEESA